MINSNSGSNKILNNMTNNMTGLSEHDQTSQVPGQHGNKAWFSRKTSPSPQQPIVKKLLRKESSKLGGFDRKDSFYNSNLNETADFDAKF